MTALFDLYSDLRRNSHESPTWRARYAPDGDLGPLFAGDEAFYMAKLAERVTDRSAQQRAACACAARVAALLPAGDSRSHAMLAMTVQALDDPAATVRVRAAYEGVYMADVEAAPSGFAAVCAVKTVYAAASLATGEPWIGRTEAEPAGLADVVQSAENALRNGEGRPRASVLAELAAILRTYVPCPTLDALRAAFAGDE